MHRVEFEKKWCEKNLLWYQKNIKTTFLKNVEKTFYVSGLIHRLRAPALTGLMLFTPY